MLWIGLSESGGRQVLTLANSCLAGEIATPFWFFLFPCNRSGLLREPIPSDGINSRECRDFRVSFTFYTESPALLCYLVSTAIKAIFPLADCPFSVFQGDSL